MNNRLAANIFDKYRLVIQSKKHTQVVPAMGEISFTIYFDTTFAFDDLYIPVCTSNYDRITIAKIDQSKSAVVYYAKSDFSGELNVTFECKAIGYVV